MNIMNQLTKKHMKNNRKRTLMTILGVIVSVAMITAVATAVTTFIHFFQMHEMDLGGNWHLKYEGLAPDKMEEAESLPNTENVFYTQDDLYGRAIGQETKSDRMPYLYLQAYTPEAREKMHLNLVEGRYPEKADEIAIPEHLSFKDGVSYKIGDTITLETGRRYKEGTECVLSQNTAYDLEYQLEEFKVLEIKSYVITGIIAKPNFEGYGTPGYTCVTYLDLANLSDQDQVTAYVYQKKVENSIYDQGTANTVKLGLDESKVEFHDHLLAYYGVSQYDNFNRMIEMLELVLLVIIMVGSISLIYNSFAISITERSKQFGMLSSVGATKQQKRNAVFYEGAMIGVIAIPLGILAGIGGMAITFSIVGPMLTSSFTIETPLTMYVSMDSILIAIVFSILTIFISAYLPALKASRISAIEAIRQIQDIKLGKKAVRTNRLVRKLFGLEGDLALKNLKRNKKRFRALVFSLFISLVLFITVSSYVYYVKKGAFMAKDPAEYDISIGFGQDTPKEELLTALKEVEGISGGLGMTTYTGEFVIPEDYLVSHLTEQAKKAKVELFRRYGYEKEEAEQSAVEDTYQEVEFVVLDDASYQAFLKENGIREESQNNEIAGILINRHVSQVGYSLIEADMLDVKAGDILPFHYQTYDAYYDEEGNKNLVPSDTISMEIKLLEVSEKLPLGISGGDLRSRIDLVLSEKMMEQFLSDLPEGVTVNPYTSYLFTVDQKDGIDDRMQPVLKSYQSTNYYYYNAMETVKENQQLLLVMSVFAYGFITLISLICIANLCNTISTSFILRRKEFAMLKSVGMTPKSFHKMIHFESLFYGLKALLYGIPVSVFMTCFIYKIVNDNFMSEFVFPWKNYFIGIAAVFCVVGVAMRYASSKIKEESIVAGLKSDIDS